MILVLLHIVQFTRPRDKVRSDGESLQLIDSLSLVPRGHHCSVGREMRITYVFLCIFSMFLGLLVPVDIFRSSFYIYV